MKLTQTSRYACLALAYLSKHKDGGFLTSQGIAEAAGISEAFMLKVLKPLVSAGVLQSYRGPGGGYRLSRAAKDVTLLEVIEAVDGPLRGRIPTWQDGEESLDQQLRQLYERAAADVRRRLEKVSLADLAKSR